jgi:hypothetical protein
MLVVLAFKHGCTSPSCFTGLVIRKQNALALRDRQHLINPVVFHFKAYIELGNTWLRIAFRLPHNTVYVKYILIFGFI